MELLQRCQTHLSQGGAIRDLEGISEMDMPAYFRGSHPSYITGVMLTVYE